MRAKHQAAFVEWAEARGGPLRGFAYLVVADHQLAEDLVQEALTKVYVNWPRMRDTAKAEAYARKVISNTAITWWRRKSSGEKPREFLPDGSAGEHESAGVVDREWIWRELQALPIRQRAAIVLRYYEDLSVAETAEYLDCSVGTIKSQVSRGLDRLRDRLGIEFEELVELDGVRS